MAAACLAGAAWSSYLGRLTAGEDAQPSEEELSALCSSGLVEVLVAVVYEQLEEQLETQHVAAFWQRLVEAKEQPGGQLEALPPSLQALAESVQQQSKQLSRFVEQLLLGLLQQQQQQQNRKWAGAAGDAQPQLQLPQLRSGQEWEQQRSLPASTVALLAGLCSRHRMAVASTLLATAPFSLQGLLQQYFQRRLLELCDVVEQQQRQQEEGPAPSSASGDDEMSGGGGAGGTAAGSPPPDPLPALGPAWASEVSAAARSLGELGLAAASEEAYTGVISGYVLRRLRALASEDFSTAVLPRTQQLVCAGPLAFLGVVLGPAGPRADAQLEEWRLRLWYLALEALGSLRAAQMFDLVVDYPDSTPALQDLAACLAQTSMAAAFASAFGAALRARLLHAGAATADIVATYVAAIRAMRLVDPGGALLDAVAEPVRRYLRGRPDAIRCIVSLLTEEEGGEGGGDGGAPGGLLQELQAQAAAAAGAGAGAGGLAAAPAAAAAAALSAAAAEAAGAGCGAARPRYTWTVCEAEGDDAALRLLGAPEAPAGGAAVAALPPPPPPPHSLAPPPSAAAAAEAPPGGAADLVSQLIGVFGGPLPFIEEYRGMLAGRLLGKDGYGCEREVATLELLKIRFGEAGLHAAEVMLKDMSDSKRLDANVHALPQRLREEAGEQQQRQQLPPGVEAALGRTRATVCSYLFWPEGSLPEHELKLPADLQTALEVYAERFRHLKAPRKLRWRPAAGLVELSVAVGGAAPIDFRVTPLHAALLLQFNDSGGEGGEGGGSSEAAGCLTAAQLAAALGVPVPVVRRGAMFWVAAGVLREQRGPGAAEVSYCRATSIDPSRIVSREASDAPWRDDAAGGPSAEDRLAAEMGPFENYIVGLLTNCGALPLDRLHNMLRVFVVSEPRYDGHSQEQLAAFLALLVARGKVEARNGVYARPAAAASG